jgi:zinc protease
MIPIRMRHAAAALLAVVALALSAARAQPRARAPRDEGPRPIDALFPSRPRIERLPNGLTVVTVAWPSPGIVAYYTLMHVGSRDEVEPGHSGFAHFFEHMMFRGTERVSQQAWERTMQSFGADTNAYTSMDSTVYTIVAPASALPTIVELEADRFQHLSYSEDVFRTEAGAVRGEYEVWSSNPAQPMWETMSELAFTRHTYGHTTIGYLRDIEAMPEKYEYSRRFFRRFYTPDNATVIVVGDFDRDALLAAIRQHYGLWRGRRDRPVIPVEPEPTQGARRDLEWPGSSPPRLWIGWRVPSFDGGARTADERRRALVETAALQVVHGLAFDASAPLYQRLVVERREVLELDSYDGEFSRDPGLFLAVATVSPEHEIDPVLDQIQEELARIGRGETPPERVRAVQEHLRYAYAMGLETPASAASLLAEMLSAAGRIEAIDEYLAALAAVTPADVARVASRYLVPSRRFVVTLRSQALASRRGEP